jgi:hypothetical protein
MVTGESHSAHARNGVSQRSRTSATHQCGPARARVGRQLGRVGNGPVPLVHLAHGAAAKALPQIVFRHGAARVPVSTLLLSAVHPATPYTHPAKHRKQGAVWHPLSACR